MEREMMAARIMDMIGKVSDERVEYVYWFLVRTAAREDKAKPQAN